MIINSDSASTKHSSELLEMICSIAQFKFDHNNFKTDSTNSANPIFQGLAMLAEEIEFLKEENQKLKEKNALLEKYNYTVAHDLKSPLMAANGIIDLLKNELSSPLDAEQQELVELLEETNNRGVSMISEILEYSKSTNSSFDLKQVDLLDIQLEIVKNYSGNHRVRISWPDKMPILLHNEMALKQVFNNLIGNAIKHNDKHLCEITITYNEDPSFHYFSVIDNGPGINKVDAEKIFDLFESSARGGNCNDGIGLAIVKQIVDRRKGKILVDPNFADGAKFTFSIPK